MTGPAWVLALIIIAVVTVNGALIAWLRRHSRTLPLVKLPPETTDEKIARWNREAAEQAQGADGDVIARVRRMERDWAEWQAELTGDGEQRG